MIVKRVPLADELPYRFYPPRLDPFCLWAAGFVMPSMLRRQQRVEEVDIAGTEHLAPLLERGDGVLLAPNHPDHADCYMMFELGRRIGMPFYYMAAYQIFAGKNQWVLPGSGSSRSTARGPTSPRSRRGSTSWRGGGTPWCSSPRGRSTTWPTG